FLERARGKIPLALLLPELKPTPARLMHFYSGLLMYFCSGVDTPRYEDAELAVVIPIRRSVLLDGL
ncbi:MAG: hypothetical protein WBQ86_01660, partial [Candidatus Binatus sp.]